MIAGTAGNIGHRSGMITARTGWITENIRETEITSSTDKVQP
jgi:hypothetical protein